MRFPPPPPQDCVPIVVYAYRRADYLRVLLADLRRAENISETLLVISHDGLFQDVFDAVAGRTTFPRGKVELLTEKSLFC